MISSMTVTALRRSSTVTASAASVTASAARQSMTAYLDDGLPRYARNDGNSYLAMTVTTALEMI